MSQAICRTYIYVRINIFSCDGHDGGHDSGHDNGHAGTHDNSHDKGHDDENEVTGDHREGVVTAPRLEAGSPKVVMGRITVTHPCGETCPS